MYFSHRSPTTCATVSMRRALSSMWCKRTLPQEKQRMGTIILTEYDVGVCVKCV
jgi:hypothetical protein